MARALFQHFQPDLLKEHISSAKKLASLKSLKGGQISFRIQEGDKEFNRIIFSGHGKTFGYDYELLERSPFRVSELNDSYERVVPLTERKKKGAEKKKAQEKLVPKSSAFAKDIFKGTEVYKNAEDEIRLFLQGKSGGNPQVFTLWGEGAVGKSVIAESALRRVCGERLSEATLYKKLRDEMSFDPDDFKQRIQAHKAIEQARVMYKRYLYQLELNAQNESEGLYEAAATLSLPSASEQQKAEIGLPEDTKKSLKKQALAAVQQELSKSLGMYRLTLADMEGGTSKMKLSDPVEKLKQVGEVKVPYNPKMGWVKFPHEMSDEEFFISCYVSNGRAAFIDEGDYFLMSGNPILKLAMNNAEYRELKFPSEKGYVESHGVIIPDTFWYSGKIVIATNTTPNEWNQAMRTRVEDFGFYLTKEQLFSRLKDIQENLRQVNMPQIPPLIVDTVRQTLYRMARSGELKKFDFRGFIKLCNRYAQTVQDVVEEARNADPKVQAFDPFIQKGEDPEKASERFKTWTHSEQGGSLYKRVNGRLKKVIMNQIQIMNRSEAKESEQNVVDLQEKPAEAQAPSAKKPAVKKIAPEPATQEQEVA